MARDIVFPVALHLISFLAREVGSISNLGRGDDASRAIFLDKKEAFSKNKKDTSLFTAKSWGGARDPSAPQLLYEKSFLA